MWGRHDANPLHFLLFHFKWWRRRITQNISELFASPGRGWLLFFTKVIISKISKNVNKAPIFRRMREQNGDWASSPLMKAQYVKSYDCYEVGFSGDVPAVHSNDNGPQLRTCFPSPSSGCSPREGIVELLQQTRTSTHFWVCSVFYPQGRNRDLEDYHFKFIKTSILVLGTYRF